MIHAAGYVYPVAKHADDLDALLEDRQRGTIDEGMVTGTWFDVGHDTDRVKGDTDYIAFQVSES